MTDEEMYKQYESMVESVVIEDFEKYESKILAQSTFSSVQQLRLLTRLRERLRPVQIPSIANQRKNRMKMTIRIFYTNTAREDER